MLVSNVDIFLPTHFPYTAIQVKADSTHNIHVVSEMNRKGKSEYLLLFHSIMTFCLLICKRRISIRGRQESDQDNS